MERGYVMCRNHATGDKIGLCGCIWVCALVYEVLAYTVVAEVLLWSTPRTLLFIKWSWVPMFLAGFDPYWIKQPASMENSEMVSIWNNTLKNKVHGPIMGPIWGRQDPYGPHVGPMNFTLWGNLLHQTMLYINLKKKHTRSVLQIIMKIGIHICIKTNIWNWLGYIFQLPISCTNVNYDTVVKLPLSISQYNSLSARAFKWKESSVECCLYQIYL